MKAGLLVIVSICIGLLLAEAGLRMFSRFGPEASARQTSGTTRTPDKPLDLEGAERYIAQLPIAPGTDRGWFSENPPPLPNRSRPSAEDEQRFLDYQRRGLFPSQADYIWNRRFVEDTNCTPDNIFRNYPPTILVFDPPAGEVRPHFRFPANTTTPEGLVTNQFGLRGPPLTLAKPPKTVRVAFLGASTTVNSHSFPFSYPERVGYWLNRLAGARHWDVHFEAINSGREGLNSSDIRAILQHEVLPLDPDLAVYYEGSNQFLSANQMVSPPISPRKQIDANDPIAEHHVPELIRTHLAIGNLLDRAWNGFSSVGEPRKPVYRLQWPAGVDERAPNVDSAALPLDLPVIIRDLDSIRSSLTSIGGQLALCSFEWLVKDGISLSPTRHEFIYKQLNTVLWPLRYADIRRLADFQNRVFERYAASRKTPFLDVARLLPQDPNMFYDAIHMSDTGERVKAWIVFQQLAPLIEREVESGQLPRPPSPGLPPPPSLAVSEMSLDCDAAPSGQLVPIKDGLSIYRRAAPSPGATVEDGHPLTVTTSPQQWAYAAAFLFEFPTAVNGRVYARLRARVVNGQVGIGVLDGGRNAFQTEKSISPSPEMKEIYVGVPDPAHADMLVIRNIAPAGVRSQILIQELELLTAGEPRPH